MNRCIVGNLDCEYQFVSPNNILPQKLRNRISASASLLRVFGGDLLWTLDEFDRTRIPASELFPRPDFISGSIPSDHQEYLYWSNIDGSTKSDTDPRRRNSVIENAWTCPQSNAAIAKVANNKQGCFELQVQKKQVLAGAVSFTEPTQLTDLNFAESWIIKPEFGVAGRGRIQGKGRPTQEQVTRINKAFKKNKSLILEPWKSRVADYGVTGFLDAKGAYDARVHTLHVDPKGGFLGIDTHQELVPESIRSQLLASFNEVGEYLRKISYQGPFGIDAFLYSDESGVPQLHALNEINARLTYGHITHAYAETVQSALVLRFGTEIPGNACPLLLPGPASPTGAWLEI